MLIMLGPEERKICNSPPPGTVLNPNPYDFGITFDTHPTTTYFQTTQFRYLTVIVTSETANGKDYIIRGLSCCQVSRWVELGNRDCRYSGRLP